MKISNGIEMLEISAVIMGRPNVIYPALIWDNDTTVLVDTGYPGQLPNIREAVNSAGVSFDRLNKIIITHHDIDHIGSLPAIVSAAPQKVEVLAHSEEEPHIKGEKPILKVTHERMAQMDSQLSALPEKQRKAIKAALDNPPKANVDRTLSDGEELPYYGGIIVIHTPGHTPGHICLYIKNGKTLIAGDAMTVVDGQLFGPQPQFTFDMDSATQSLKKLKDYDIKKVICYHGGLYEDNPNKRIAELADV